jgi:hydroxymethylglutaryl-CoA lyase
MSRSCVIPGAQLFILRSVNSNGAAMDVTVSEVGPRDGLQSIKRTLPTEAKHRWIAALAAAGLREIEVGSFVSPKVLPQMADCAEVVARARTIEGLGIVVLVPNLRYATMAFEAGTHVITIPVSVSEPHSLANIRKTHPEIIAEVRAIVKLRNERFPAIKVETSLSTAFGCTIKGIVPENDVLRMAAAMVDAGSDTINLADTVGYANPAQVKRLFTRLRREVGDKAGGAHLHNTRGQGLANVVAALDAGVTTFDSSQGGIGGCPYAPGATGNIVTEDLVFLLESMGLDTGIDLDRLIAARAILAEALPGEALYGHVPAAGLPKGFAPAAAGRAA